MNSTGPDLETRLRSGLAARAADVDHAPDGLADGVRAGFRRSQRRRVGAVAAGVCAAIAAVAIPLAVEGDVGQPDVASGQMQQAVEASYVPFDVAPRGDLAADAGYVQDLIDRPWSTLPEYAGPPAAARHVVYAGEVDGEVEALVIGWQDDAWQGIWWEGSAGASVADLAATGDAQPIDPAFTYRYTGSVLLLIGRPGDTIEVSPRQDIAAEGTATPAAFVSVADATGVGTVDGEALGGLGHIRVTRGGQVVVDQEFRAGQESREGAVDGLDLSGPLAGAAGDPDEAVVRGLVQSVLVQTGSAPADVVVDVLWGGDIGTGGVDATAAVVSVTLPSGAVVVVGGYQSPQQPAEGDALTAGGLCARAVQPAGTDVRTAGIAMRCDLYSVEDGAQLGSRLIVVPPAGAAALRLTGLSGADLGEVPVDDAVYVGPAPDGIASAVALDNGGAAIVTIPLTGIEQLGG